MSCSPAPFGLIATNHGLAKISFFQRGYKASMDNSSLTKNWRLSLEFAKDVDYHYGAKLVVFSDYIDIKTASLFLGLNQQTLVPKEPGRHYDDITVDWVNDRVYFVVMMAQPSKRSGQHSKEPALRQVHSVALNGRDRKVHLSMRAQLLSNLVVDPCRGYVYHCCLNSCTQTRVLGDF